MTREGARPKAVASALLLALSALVAAALTSRAAMLAGRATARWQESLREQALFVEDFLTSVSATLTMDVAYLWERGAEGIYAEELRRQAESARGDVRAGLLAMATTHDQNSRPAEAEAYRFPEGGYDAHAIVRDTVREVIERKGDFEEQFVLGDAYKDRTVREVAATMPAAVAFLLYGFAQSARRRRVLTVAGSVTLSVAIAAGIANEVFR